MGSLNYYIFIMFLNFDSLLFLLFPKFKLVSVLFMGEKKFDPSPTLSHSCILKQPGPSPNKVYILNTILIIRSCIDSTYIYVLRNCKSIMGPYFIWKQKRVHNNERGNHREQKQQHPCKQQPPGWMEGSF